MAMLLGDFENCEGEIRENRRTAGAETIGESKHRGRSRGRTGVLCGGSQEKIGVILQRKQKQEKGDGHAHYNRAPWHLCDL